MIIFPPTQTLMRIFGYQYTYSEKDWYRWYNYGVFACTCLLFVPITTFFIQNIHDVGIMAESMSLSSGEVNAMIKGLVYILNRNKIKHLLIMLQRNVDLKEKLGRTNHYVAMNKQATFWSRIDIFTMTNSICSICFGPILVVFYHFLLGDLNKKMFLQPVGMTFPFDQYQSPAFAFVYCLCCVSIPCIGYTIALIDCFFMGVCSQIIACQKDLQDMLLEIAADETTHYRGRQIGMQPNDKAGGKLIECVRFHNEISGFIETIGEVSSPIIFAQFILSVLQMGSLFFQIRVVKDMPIDRHASNIITSIVALSELFIYCYYGNEVSYQGAAVSDAAYASGWYKCSPKHRRYISLIMLRAKRVHIFKGFKMVNCSLESYTTVLNMVGSALALLKSVSNEITYD